MPLRLRAWLVLLGLLAACGGGGSGGGTLGLSVVNETPNAVLTRMEYLDLATEQVVDAAEFNLLPGQTWNGRIRLPTGSYWVVAYGHDADTGDPCDLDDRDFGYVSDVDAGDRNLVHVYRSLFCDRGGP